jgi:hypothetical protein
MYLEGTPSHLSFAATTRTVSTVQIVLGGLVGGSALSSRGFRAGFRLGSLHNNSLDPINNDFRSLSEAER